MVHTNAPHDTERGCDFLYKVKGEQRIRNWKKIKCFGDGRTPADSNFSFKPQYTLFIYKHWKNVIGTALSRKIYWKCHFMKKQLRRRNIKEMKNVCLNIKSHFLQQNNDKAGSQVRQLRLRTTKHSLTSAQSDGICRSSIGEVPKDEK